MQLNLIFLNNYIVQDYSVLNNSVRPVIYEIITQLAHYVFTTLQFGCCLVRSLSYVKITLPQRILDT
jgi:hypothetical protein